MCDSPNEWQTSLGQWVECNVSAQKLYNIYIYRFPSQVSLYAKVWTTLLQKGIWWPDWHVSWLQIVCLLLSQPWACERRFKELYWFGYNLALFFSIVLQTEFDVPEYYTSSQISECSSENSIRSRTFTTRCKRINQERMFYSRDVNVKGSRNSYKLASCTPFASHNSITSKPWLFVVYCNLQVRKNAQVQSTLDTWPAWGPLCHQVTVFFIGWVSHLVERERLSPVYGQHDSMTNEIVRSSHFQGRLERQLQRLSLHSMSISSLLILTYWMKTLGHFFKGWNLSWVA